MQIAELIELKVSEGKDILIELDEMRKARGAAIHVNYYVNEDVEKSVDLLHNNVLAKNEIK